jgi:hypothetical protein
MKIANKSLSPRSITFLFQSSFIIVQGLGKDCRLKASRNRWSECGGALDAPGASDLNHRDWLRESLRKWLKKNEK